MSRNVLMLMNLLMYSFFIFRSGPNPFVVLISLSIYTGAQVAVLFLVFEPVDNFIEKTMVKRIRTPMEEALYDLLKTHKFNYILLLTTVSNLIALPLFTIPRYIFN